MKKVSIYITPLLPAPPPYIYSIQILEYLTHPKVMTLEYFEMVMGKERGQWRRTRVQKHIFTLPSFHE